MSRNIPKQFILILFSILTLMIGMFLYFRNVSYQTNELSNASGQNVNVTFRFYYYQNSSQIGEVKQGMYVSPHNSNKQIEIGKVLTWVSFNDFDNFFDDKGYSNPTANISSKSVQASGYANKTGLHMVSHRVDITIRSDYRCNSGFGCTGDASETFNLSIGMSGGSTLSRSRSLYFYPISYKDTYYAEGGTFNGGTTETESNTDFYNSYNTPSPPTRTGYTFAGWWTEDGNTRIDVSGVIKENAEDEKLHARWTANTYTVTLDKQGGSGGDSSVIATYNSAMPTIKTPSRVGYSFQGYYTGTNGSGTRYYDNNGISVRNWDKASSTRLYAYWTARDYKLTANANIPQNTQSKISWGSLPSGWSQTSDALSATRMVEYDSGYGTLPTPSLPGYTFVGWFDTSANSGGNRVTSSTLMKEGICGWAQNNDNAKIYARWTANRYSVVFNGNGNTGGSMNSQTFTYDKSQNLTSNGFTKTGYHFIGWSTSPSGSVVYANEASVTNLTSTNNGTVNLYAKWAANTYTVNFNGNGNTGGSTESQSFTYDSSQPLTPNGFTRQGYYFVGWSTSSTGAVVYKDGESVKNLTSSQNGSVELYAVWQDTWANHGTQPTGSGASTDPYIIDSAEDLAWMIKNHGKVLRYYKQTKAIDLGGRPWYPIGSSESPFMGVYDGQGFEIKNFNIPEITNASGGKIQSDVGLFGWTEGATINGIILDSATVYGKDNVGLLVSSATSTNINSNIIKNSKIYASGNSGAIAGNVSGGQVKYNLVYLTENSGTSTKGLYTGSSDFATNLIDINGNRSYDNLNDLSGWGIVVGKLLPEAISWGAKIDTATKDDITNWIDKKLN